MEIIRKRTCLDDLISHRNGLVPYVDNDIITYVTAGNTNGNFERVVCDFVKEYFDDTEVKPVIASGDSRLRYLDIMRMYNFCQEQMEKSVYVKRVDLYDFISAATCNGDGCGWSESYETKWVAVDDCEIEKWLRENDGSVVVPVEWNEFATKDEFWYTSETYTGSEKYIQLIPEYDKIQEFENDWQNWWTDSGGGSTYYKEMAFGSGYTSSSTLTFYNDVEKYLLGKIKVPCYFISGDTECELSAPKMPKYIFNLTYNDYYSWFENNVGRKDSDKKINKEWNDRGGDCFYNYLKNLKLNWIYPKPKSQEGDVYVTFAKPYVDYDSLLISEYKPETLLVPYEYSVDSTCNIHTVVKPYDSANTIYNPNGGLVQKYINFEEEPYGPIPMAESKLSQLVSEKAIHLGDNLFGIMEPFEDSVLNGQMYQCFYYTSGSVESGITKYESLDMSDREGVVISADTKPNVVSASNIACINIIEYNFDSEFTEQFDEETKEVYWTKNFTRNYGWWECVPYNGIDASAMTCANGEKVNGWYIGAGKKKYRNAAVLDIISAIETAPSDGKSYFFLVRYNNGRKVSNGAIDSEGTIITMDIPYEVNVPINITEINGKTYYDIISALTIDETGQTAVVDYVMGATSGDSQEETASLLNTTGVHYREEIYYERNVVERVTVDGIYPCDIYYNKMSQEGNEICVSDDDLRLTRMAVRAQIIGMETGVLWNEDNAVQTILFAKESLSNMFEEPNYDVSLTYNRGNGAAWEKHFKLSECNTMEDLVNYGNNYFNL